MKLMRVGVDLAKNVFQVHGVDRDEKPALRKRRRIPRHSRRRRDTHRAPVADGEGVIAPDGTGAPERSQVDHGSSNNRRPFESVTGARTAPCWNLLFGALLRVGDSLQP